MYISRTSNQKIVCPKLLFREIGLSKFNCHVKSGNYQMFLRFEYVVDNNINFMHFYYYHSTMNIYGETMGSWTYVILVDSVKVHCGHKHMFP